MFSCEERYEFSPLDFVNLFWAFRYHFLYSPKSTGLELKSVGFWLSSQGPRKHLNLKVLPSNILQTLPYPEVCVSTCVFTSSFLYSIWSSFLICFYSMLVSQTLFVPLGSASCYSKTRLFFFFFVIRNHKLKTAPIINAEGLTYE